MIADFQTGTMTRQSESNSQNQYIQLNVLDV